MVPQGKDNCCSFSNIWRLIDELKEETNLAILAYRCNDPWQDHSLDYFPCDNRRPEYILARKILFHNDLGKIRR